MERGEYLAPNSVGILDERNSAICDCSCGIDPCALQEALTQNQWNGEVGHHENRVYELDKWCLDI